MCWNANINTLSELHIQQSQQFFVLICFYNIWISGCISLNTKFFRFRFHTRFLFRTLFWFFARLCLWLGIIIWIRFSDSLNQKYNIWPMIVENQVYSVNQRTINITSPMINLLHTYQTSLTQH